jgi:transposase
MPGKAAKVVISEMQQSVLEEIAASRTAAVRLVQRVKIILLAFRGMLNEQISAEVDLNPDQVGTWRRRWQQSFESLIAVECVYLPKHTSWLNQIEIWFGILRRKAIRRGFFRSLTQLKDRILDFIDYYNATMARPFQWTYHGKVLRR